MLTSGLLRRAADRLWRVDFRDPLLSPLIILLEFQSTPDPRMPWRILEYRTLALDCWTTSRRDCIVCWT